MRKLLIMMTIAATLVIPATASADGSVNGAERAAEQMLYQDSGHTGYAYCQLVGKSKRRGWAVKEYRCSWEIIKGSRSMSGKLHVTYRQYHGSYWIHHYNFTHWS